MAVKTPPCQEWSIREKLCLASAVMRSGDQNWMSVSRAIKPFPEPGRPTDWNTPKNCAIQYSGMLSEVDTPKRKRSGDRAGDIVETPGDLIVKKMTFDRVEELKQMLADDRRKFKLLREEIELIESGALDEKLPEILADIREKKRQAEEQRLAEEKLSAERLAKREEQRKQSPGKKVARLSETERTDVDGTVTPTEETLAEVVDLSRSTLSRPSSVVEDASPGPSQPSQAAKPTTPMLLPKLLVTEKREEKKEPISKEQISDIKEMLSKPDADKTRTNQSEAHPPAEKEVSKNEKKETPTLSKLLLTSGPTYASLTKEATTGEDKAVTVTAAATKVTSAAKVSDVVEVESTDEVQVTEVEESTPTLLPVPQLQVPSMDEESSDVSIAASTAPSSPSATKMEESMKKRKRGRPKKKERVDIVDGADQARPASESADETKDGARSETAESEGTERPSESDRDSLSNVQVAGSVFGESLPNSPSSLSLLDDLQDHPSKQWKKAIMLVWREAASHKYANLFLHPVTNDIAPGYSSTVHRRMDLSSIKRKLENGTIRTVEAFQRDMMLMFQNAIMYNRSDHDVYRMACNMQTDVLKSIEEFISTQMLVRNPESSKSLRGRRTVDEMDHTSGKAKRKTRGDE